MSDTPCLGICVIEDDVCLGCGRTLDEIEGNQAPEGTGQQVPSRPEGPQPADR